MNFQLHENIFTNSWIMYSTFSNFKENTFIEHVKINLKVSFQKAILNQMKFIWYQIWSLFDHCTKSCTWMSRPLERTARRCSCTDSWCTGPRWTSTRHPRARWDMLWSPHKHMAYGMIVNTKTRIQQWVTQMLQYW